MVTYIYKFTSKWHSQTTSSSEREYPGPENVFSTLYWQANPQLSQRVLKPSSIPINLKLRSTVKGIELQQDEMVNNICKLTSKWHSQTTSSSEPRQPGAGNVFTTLCWQPNAQLWHRVLKPPSVPINPKLRSNGKVIELEQDEMMSHLYKLTSKRHSQTTLSLECRYQAPGNVFSTLYWQANLQLSHRVLKHPSLVMNPKPRSKVKGIER